MASLTARQFADVLSGLEGRAAQALALRLLEGRSRAECATFFGISPQAFDVMLLRAALALEAGALSGPRQPLLPSQEEQRQAEALAGALEGGDPQAGALADPAVRRLGLLLRNLRSLADEIRARLEQAELETAASPQAHWGGWIRRLVVLLLIAAALYLYRRQRSAPEGQIEPRQHFTPVAPVSPPPLPRGTLRDPGKAHP